MKKTNKFLASTLALTLALTAVAPISAFAAEPECSMKLSKTYLDSYTLTIPEGTDNLAEGQEFRVSAQAFLDYGEELTVSVTSENGWALKDKAHPENSAAISYQMSCGGRILATQTEKILTVSSDDEDQQGTAVMTVNAISAPAYAGTYEEILTFKTEVTKSEDENSVETTEAVPYEHGGDYSHIGGIN